jgi:hypothetical protein
VAGSQSSASARYHALGGPDELDRPAGVDREVAGAELVRDPPDARVDAQRPQRARQPLAGPREAVVHPRDRVGLADHLVDAEAAAVVRDRMPAGRAQHRLEAVGARGRASGGEPRPQRVEAPERERRRRPVEPQHGT